MKHKKNNTGTRASAAKPLRESKHETFYFILLGIAMAAVAMTRIRLLSIPFERDEGEYAYMGSLILEGIPLYEEAYNMKLPGTNYIYALFMAVFGKTVEAVHIGLLLFNLMTMYFTFLLGRQVFGMFTGVTAAAVYGFMAINHTLLGFAAHATHFVVLPVIAGVYYLYRYSESPKITLLTAGGFLIGAGFVMKQQAVLFIVFALVYWLMVSLKKINLKRSLFHGLLFFVSILLPYSLVVLVVYAQGSFDKFWFWTVEYASKYASGLGFDEGKATFVAMFTHIIKGSEWFWYLSGIGLACIPFIHMQKGKKWFALLFVIFSFLSVCPGFYFRNHYWILLLPALGICIGILLQFISDTIEKKLAYRSSLLLIFVPFVISAYTMKKEKWYYFDDDPYDVCKNVYKPNPFTEAVELSEYIKANSKPEDKIAILGSEPEIFFYSDRKSASGYIYTYGLVEQHAYNLTMQKEMINEIESAKPEFLIFCRIPVSWLIRPNTPDLIFKWYEKYIADNYTIEAIVDVLDDEVSVFKYGKDALTYKPGTENNLFLFRKKSGSKI